MKKPTHNLVIEPKVIMSHFCWAYCNALLEKLISLDAEDKIFEKGLDSAKKESLRGTPSQITCMALAVIGKIEEQTAINYEIHFQATPEIVGEIIKETWEFLEMFETNKIKIDVGTLRSELSKIVLDNNDSHECADDIIDLFQKKYGVI